MKYYYICFITLIMFVKSFNLYVLELAKNKYYIGKTCKSVTDRFITHKKGFGSEWTKLYKPIKIIEQFESNDKFDEDKYTKKYMDKFGIDNVRGGSYSNITLTDWQTKALEHEFKTSNDLCFKCGQSGHFASDCYKFSKKNIFNNNFFKF
jgi:predicted GIY-YIG superfamily endonuclease